MSDKTITKREVVVDVDLSPAMYSYSDRDFDLQEGQSLAEFIAEQKARGETALSCAKDLDLLDDVSLNLQVVEHYSDGSKKCVDRITWECE